MKTLLEILLRTFSIIKTHLTLFNHYRNYSCRLQHDKYRVWRNKKYPENIVTEAINVCCGKKSGLFENVNYSGSPNDKKEHFILKNRELIIYVKAFNNINFKLLLRNFFRSSKALKFYVCAFEMKKLSIPIAEPVFAAERKFLGVKFRSLIATEEVKDSKPFICHYPAKNLSPDKKRTYMRKLAELIFLLNIKKTAHADLLGNILVREISGIPELFLIDNDAVKLFNHINRFDKIKHFEGFYNFFITRSDVPKHEDWNLLCEEYLKIDPEFSPSVEMLTDDVKNRKNLGHYIKKNIFKL